MTKQTNEMTELYCAPKCKVLKTTFKRAILAESGGFTVNDLDEENFYEN